MRLLSTGLLAFSLALPAALVLPAQDAEARSIERACNASERRAASPALCGCIQRVADQMLTNGDQRRAARFFRDPQRAQEVRKSDTRADDAFWQRWRDYARTARDICS
ncbi:MAG: hypothetical protein GVY27_09940 [Deinococcus-Thermus bacterium]|jgi:hypothetical protein|nr:hypothetical protein [Deinococcota bacterium]